VTAQRREQRLELRKTSAGPCLSTVELFEGVGNQTVRVFEILTGWVAAKGKTLRVFAFVRMANAAQRLAMFVQSVTGCSQPQLSVILVAKTESIYSRLLSVSRLATEC
jgi:hypothetical protein